MPNVKYGPKPRAQEDHHLLRSYLKGDGSLSGVPTAIKKIAKNHKLFVSAQNDMVLCGEKILPSEPEAENIVRLFIEETPTIGKNELFRKVREKYCISRVFCDAIFEQHKIATSNISVRDTTGIDAPVTSQSSALHSSAEQDMDDTTGIEAPVTSQSSALHSSAEQDMDDTTGIDAPVTSQSSALHSSAEQDMDDTTGIEAPVTSQSSALDSSAEQGMDDDTVDDDKDLTKKDIIQPSVSTFMDTTDTDWFEDSQIAGVQGFSLSTTNGSQGKVMNGVTTLSDSIPSEPNTMNLDGPASSRGSASSPETGQPPDQELLGIGQQLTPGNTDVMVRCCHCGSSICDQPNFCDDTSMATYLPLIPLRETASTEETEESESPITMQPASGNTNHVPAYPGSCGYSACDRTDCNEVLSPPEGLAMIQNGQMFQPEGPATC